MDFPSPSGERRTTEDAELAAFLSDVTPAAAAIAAKPVPANVPIVGSSSARKPPAQPVDAIVSISMKPSKAEPGTSKHSSHRFGSTDLGGNTRDLI